MGGEAAVTAMIGQKVVLLVPRDVPPVVDVRANTIDPLDWCDRAIRGEITDLTYIVNEAATARDIVTVLKVQALADELRAQLRQVELLAVHLADQIAEPRR